MNCETYTDHIGDLVDGTISPERRAQLDRHLAGCESCRALVADLQEIRGVASRLAVHKPPERVWQHLAAKLPEAMREPADARRRFSLGAWFRSAFTLPRLAWGGAVALVLVAVLLTVLLPRVLAPTIVRIVPGTAPVNAPPPGVHPHDDVLVQSVESELQAAEQHYQKAIGGLEKMAKDGESSLDPQLAGTIRTNLAVVDQAINESRTALANQPTNELAQESLFDAFRRKVGLLQDTVAMMNEMRKGNQAEAAKILGNMNK